MSITNWEALQELLQDCNSVSSSASLEEADYITFQLECWNHYLAGYITDLLPSEPVDHVHYTALRELHQCINNLHDIWLIKLARIEAVQTEGRPRKQINIELVRCVHSIQHVYVVIHI